jgi:glucokinase
MAIRCAVGLDVGGTKIAGGLVAFPSGTILTRRTLPTGADRGGEAVLEDALALAAELLEAAGQRQVEVLGIGVAVAELVDCAGNVTSGQTIAWAGLPVQGRFWALCSGSSAPGGGTTPAVVEADVRAAALAEALFGAGREFRLFVYVTVGTGISCCLVQEGRPFPGAHGNALVMASGPWTTRCPACHTEADLVLEEFASGPALVARYRGARECRPQAAGAAALPVTRAEEVLAAVEAGDPVAREVVRTAGEALGNCVGFLVNVLDPEAVIVGGGLGLAGGLYWDRFIAATRAHIWAESSRDLPILPAALGVDAGLVGAATAIWQRADR